MRSPLVHLKFILIEISHLGFRAKILDVFYVIFLMEKFTNKYVSIVTQFLDFWELTEAGLIQPHLRLSHIDGFFTWPNTIFPLDFNIWGFP